MVAKRWADVCAALAPEAVQELIEEAKLDNPDATTCTAAAPLVLIPELGRVPIVGTEVQGDTAVITVGDAQYSDSGNDNFNMQLIDGSWKVLDL